MAEFLSHFSKRGGQWILTGLWLVLLFRPGEGPRCDALGWGVYWISTIMCYWRHRAKYNTHWHLKNNSGPPTEILEWGSQAFGGWGSWPNKHIYSFDFVSTPQQHQDMQYVKKITQSQIKNTKCLSYQNLVLLISRIHLVIFFGKWSKKRQ